MLSCELGETFNLRTPFLQATVFWSMKAYVWLWLSTVVWWKVFLRIFLQYPRAYLHWIGTFVKLKIRWIHMTIKMIPQNLENKFTSFYFSKAFFSGLIRREAVRGVYSVSIKTKSIRVKKVVRKLKDFNLKDFILFVEGYLKLFYYNRWLKIF